MAGVNAVTGEILDGFDHVEQSIGKIITTRIGERVVREWFGNPGLSLLGENATQETVLRWFNTIWALIELFEPRFEIIKFDVSDISRLGDGDFTMEGRYIPGAQLDYVQARAFVSIAGETVTIRVAV